MKKIILYFFCLALASSAVFAQTVDTQQPKSSDSKKKVTKIFGKFVSRRGKTISIEDNNGNTYTCLLSAKLRPPKLRKGDLVGLIIMNGKVTSIVYRK